MECGAYLKDKQPLGEGTEDTTKHLRQGQGKAVSR